MGANDLSRKNGAKVAMIESRLSCNPVEKNVGRCWKVDANIYHISKKSLDEDFSGCAC